MLTQSLTSYLNYLKDDRLFSANWIRGSKSTLTHFLSWLQERPLSTDTVNEYFRFRSDWKESTRNQNMSRIVEYAKFLKITLELKYVKEPIRVTEALDTETVESLLRGLESPERAVVTFLCETGFRWSELISLTPSQVFTDHTGTYVRLFSKGKKEREMPLSRKAVMALPNIPFPITPGYVKRVRKVLRQAGVQVGIRENIHPHLFRATFASQHLNVKGTDSSLVALMMGHSSTSTLMKHYYKPNRLALRKALGE